MRRTTWLDALVLRFQHRWETNPQYRAAVAGVAGLVLVLLMCSCMGVVSLTANSALASIGLAGGSGSGASGNGSADTGTNRLTGAQQLPTSTVPSYGPPAIPMTTVPTSQTPIPTPTDPPTPTPSPTATPCQGNCGGGPGGGGGGGGGGTVSASASPTPWHANQAAQVNVVSSSPNTGINIIIQFSNGATILNNGQGQTDGSGNYTFSFIVPGSVSGGQASIVVMASSGAGTTIHQNCA